MIQEQNLLASRFSLGQHKGELPVLIHLSVKRASSLSGRDWGTSDSCLRFSSFVERCKEKLSFPPVYLLYSHATTTLTTLLTPDVWGYFYPHPAILSHPLGVLPCNSVLTFSVWR